jgi:hypothetical protein
VQIYYGGIQGLKMKDFTKTFISWLTSDKFATARFAYSQESAGWYFLQDALHTMSYIYF